MNNYLIFRTDRIGDFLLSAVLIKSIKRNDIKSKITVIASKKNYNYIKNFNLVDEVILFPQENFLLKINFIFNIIKKKFHCVLALDGKKRSLYCSTIISSRIKVAVVTKSFLKIFFHFFFSKIIHDNFKTSKIDTLKNILIFLKYDFSQSDLNTLETHNFRNPFNDEISSFLIKKNFVMLHFDEKWIYEKYITTYQNIEPSQSEFENFIFNIIKKSKKNLVITNGLIHNPLLDNLKTRFNRLNNNTCQMNYENNSIILFNNINFFDIQYLVFKANLFIACHGAVTHVASALNVKIFDIIDPSENSLFENYAHHFRNYTPFLRNNFSALSNNLIDKLS